ncbi:MAG: hypothetical protein IJM83_02605, partial [Firmicutes bacterium]|nr:hypothetical protein [Bacillota bacterium]
NAVNSLWMKEFTVCDWDMFQTGHPQGAYHAAARAISGGPVYVSDRVGEHDFSLIRTLTDAEGKILRTLETAVPTPDCLFRDPRKDHEPYKIVSRNEAGYVAGVFAFADVKSETSISADDLPVKVTEKMAVYRYKAGDSQLLNRGEALRQNLEEGGYELITMAPVREGFALIGLTEKMNSGGGTEHIRYTGRGISFVVKDEGKLLIYTEKKLKSIRHDGAPLAFAKEATGFLTLQISHAGQLEIEWEEQNG